MSFGKKIGFFSAFILPALLVGGGYLGGWGYSFSFLFGFLLIPLLDYLVGLDPNNLEDDKITFISKERYYRLILYLWVFIQTGVLFWCFYHISTTSLQPLEWLAFALSTATVTGGIGITVAHELGHKRSSLQRFYSKVLLLEVFYMHFIIEHNKGHHVHVATPADPATARKGESFYGFWVRSVFKGYFHAWSIERQRLQKTGSSLFKNKILWYTLTPIFFIAIVTAVFSVVSGRFIYEVPIFYLVQSLFAFTLLEHVNYIEHYGILRKEIEPGKYERVNEKHSWNANHLLSNFFLFQLQRHSDHHMNATRPYQALKQYEQSPQLPAGYPAMVLLSLIPPLWFKVMDKRLEKHLALSKSEI